eukprot:7443275-Alexandrium_andersonii.AAC.1
MFPSTGRPPTPSRRAWSRRRASTRMAVRRACVYQQECCVNERKTAWADVWTRSLPHLVQTRA